jgi:hypothetical protein
MNTLSNTEPMPIVESMQITEPMPIVEADVRFDLYKNPIALQCQANADKWDDTWGEYFRGILCCKEVGKHSDRALKPAFDAISEYITNTYEEVKEHAALPLCALPLGHTGKCCINPHTKMFTVSLDNKFDTGIYSTPGNDGYVFKNRCSRRFSIRIPTVYERQIKNKEKKLNCSIPIKDASTPMLLVAAYFDMLVYVSSIQGISKNAEHEYWGLYGPLIETHKAKLAEVFGENGRKIFNEQGYTWCPITHYIFVQDDLTRDSRVEPKETDVQLGHCVSRKDTEYTIRGMNVVMMSRKGNRLVGDYDFFDNEWIEDIKKVASHFM